MRVDFGHLRDHVDRVDLCVDFGLLYLWDQYTTSVGLTRPYTPASYCSSRLIAIQSYFNDLLWDIFRRNIS
jgi:hypothetical protein